jgi:hypothetical protein
VCEVGEPQAWKEMEVYRHQNFSQEHLLTLNPLKQGRAVVRGQKYFLGDIAGEKALREHPTPCAHYYG